jgi:hypothetical protein
VFLACCRVHAIQAGPGKTTPPIRKVVRRTIRGTINFFGTCNLNYINFE